MLVQVQLEAMIRSQSILRIIDNSGGKKAKCIKVKGKSGKSVGKIGDMVVVSIKKLRQQYDKRSKAKMRKSEIYCGIIVQSKANFFGLDGKSKKFNHNSICITNSTGKVMSNRIFTVLPRELRLLKWSKLGSMSKGYV